MRNHTFLYLSILAGAVALISLLEARDWNLKAAHIRAVRRQAAHVQHIAYVPDPEAARWGGNAEILDIAGLASVVLCVGFLLTASIRHESGWYSIPLLLILFDFIAFLLLSD